MIADGMTQQSMEIIQVFLTLVLVVILGLGVKYVHAIADTLKEKSQKP
jgi:hypothetical protein